MKLSFGSTQHQTFLAQFLIVIFIISLNSLSYAQEKKSNSGKNRKSNVTNKTEFNDANTPLHLLQPDYPINYQAPDKDQIENQLKTIVNYLEQVTPAGIIDSKSQKVITKYENIDRYSQLKKGDFRLTSYEWGVTYAAMLRMTQVTDNETYLNYARNRFAFLAETAPYFKKQLDEVGTIDPLMTKVLQPKALDDAGAICAAMIKTSTFDKTSSKLDTLIGNYIDYIMYHQYRLKDGTFARKRPLYNTVWLDDLFMSIPALLQMGKYRHDDKYTQEAVKQIKLFKDKLFVENEGLFRHGWAEGLEPEPTFFLGASQWLGFANPLRSFGCFA